MTGSLLRALPRVPRKSECPECSVDGLPDRLDVCGLVCAQPIVVML